MIWRPRLTISANSKKASNTSNPILFSYPYLSLPPINPKPLKEFQFPPWSFIYVFVFVCVCMHVFKLNPLDVLYFFRYCEESPSEKEVHYPARRERARPQGFFLLISYLFFCLVIGKVKESEKKMSFF